MAQDIYLLTRINDKSQVAFENEADIYPSLQTTYSAMDYVIDKIGRDTYIVKVNTEDTINADVFTVQRITLLEIPTHL